MAKAHRFLAHGISVTVLALAVIHSMTGVTASVPEGNSLSGVILADDKWDSPMPGEGSTAAERDQY